MPHNLPLTISCLVRWVDHIVSTTSRWPANAVIAIATTSPQLLIPTQTMVPLFNPRTQRWAEHVVWTADGLSIVGTTPTGRATCNRLDMNDERHNDGAIVKAQGLWLQGG